MEFLRFHRKDPNSLMERTGICAADTKPLDILKMPVSKTYFWSKNRSWD